MLLVAYELGKTVDEIDHLTTEELFEWLAFFKIRSKEIKKAMKQRN